MTAAQGLYAEGLNVSAATTTWVDVCTIAAGSFTAGKKYLILAVAHLRNDTSAANEGRMRLVHGTTPTLFTDASAAYEETAANQDTVLGWMEVWTQPGTEELVKLQISSSSTTTARALLGQIFALKLSDDFTENTDYFYNEVTADYTTTATPAAQASVTFTPNGTDRYLVIAQSAVDAVGITTEYMQSIYESVANLNIPTIEVENEDATNEYRQYLLARVFTPSAVSHTFSTNIWGESAGDHIALSSRIFVLRLDKFAAIGYYYLEGEDQPSATWETEAGVTVTPTVTGDWFYLGWFGNDVGSLTDNLETRLQVNPDGGGLVSDPAYGDASPGADAWDATDVTPFAIFNFRSLSSGAARTINLDCQLTSGTTLRVQTRTLAAFSMELVSSGYILQTTTGTFALSGNNAILLSNRKMLTTAGGYALTGNDAKLQKGYPLKTTVGAFALTGSSATLLLKRLVKTAVGGFTLSGSNAILKRGLLVKITTGTFALSGNNSVMAKGYPLKTTVGAFTLSGSAAYLLFKRQVRTTAGGFTFTGSNTILLRAQKIFASAGSYILSGSNAVLKSTRLVKTTAGSFALTGNNAYLLRSRSIYSTSGTFTLSGNNGILRFTHLVKTTTGGFAWVGNDAILTYSAGFTAYHLLTIKGDFVLSGSNAYLRYYRKTFTTAGSFTWTGNNARILAARKTFTTAGSYTLSGSEILAAGRSVRSAAGSFTWTRNNEILLYGRNILGACGSYSLVGSWVIFLIAYQVRTSQGIYILTGRDANMKIVGAGIKSDGMGIGLFVGMERKEQNDNY